MKYRFLLHSLSHTILAVDITGLSANIAGLGVNGTSLPFIQFTSWDKARRHFEELGAGEEPLDTTHQQLRRASVAVVTIT
jgi:hypothetical protein